MSGDVGSNPTQGEFSFKHLFTSDEREQSSEDDATPSASFIETANPARNPHTTEKPTELGWKVYSLKEKNMRMKLHIEFLKTCMEENIIPKG